MHSENGKNDPPNASHPSPPEAAPTTKENKLESPSEQLILLRKQMLIEKLLKKKSTPITSSDSAAAEAGPVRKTLKMGPSSVLSRVKDFLPVMKTENEKLLLQAVDNPGSVCLEVDVDDDKVGDDLGQPMVELNLALMPQEDNEETDSSSDEESQVNLLNHGQQQSQSLKDDNKHNSFGKDGASNPVDSNTVEKKGNSKKLIEDVTQEDAMNQES